ncbi:MAG: lactonase family protein [Anaerolineae bacterium]
MNESCSSRLILVGTYAKQDDKGIYGFKLNQAKMPVEPLGVVAAFQTTSYQALSSDGKFMYSIIEVDGAGSGANGAVAAFALCKDCGELKLLNYQLTQSNAPCHVCVDRANKYLFAANYEQGKLNAFALNPDGTVGALLSTIQHTGSGVNKDRQERAHAHFVSLTPDQKYLCAVDLGIDKIVVYDLNHATGALTRNDAVTVDIKAGSGPRHLAFHPSGRYAYLMTELTSEVVVMEYTPTGFKQIQTISSLPEGYTGVSWSSAIRVSPDGNTVYTSNRGHDSIGVFHVDGATGRLTLVEHASTQGKWPRDFAVDPCGHFLVAANEHSGTVVLFDIDLPTGKLIPSGISLQAPKPGSVNIICG